MSATAKYFSIHSLKALKKGDFSIIVANVDNTEEKVNLAKSLYESENWHLEYHDYKINMTPLINK